MLVSYNIIFTTVIEICTKYIKPYASAPHSTYIKTSHTTTGGLLPPIGSDTSISATTTGDSSTCNNIQSLDAAPASTARAADPDPQNT